MPQLTTAQFAERAGVSPARVRQWIGEGRIRAKPLNPRMSMIDSRELSKVSDRKPGRPRKSA